MPNYKKMYFHLFNRITDIIEELKKIQIEGEDMYLDTYDEFPEDAEDEKEEAE